MKLKIGRRAGAFGPGPDGWTMAKRKDGSLCFAWHGTNGKRVGLALCPSCVSAKPKADAPCPNCGA